MRRANLVLEIVLALAMFGCATTARDWADATHIGTTRAYRYFMARHPSTKESKLALAKIEELIARAKEENPKRVKKIEAYRVGTTTLAEFRADGWNVLDPYYHMYGIVSCFVSPEGAPRDSVELNYVLGWYLDPPGDPSIIDEYMLHYVESYRTNPIVETNIISIIYGACTLTFSKDNVLRAIEWSKKQQ